MLIIRLIQSIFTVEASDLIINGLKNSVVRAKIPGRQEEKLTWKFNQIDRVICGRAAAQKKHSTRTRHDSRILCTSATDSVNNGSLSAVFSFVLVLSMRSRLFEQAAVACTNAISQLRRRAHTVYMLCVAETDRLVVSYAANILFRMRRI